MNLKLNFLKIQLKKVIEINLIFVLNTQDKKNKIAYLFFLCNKR